MNILDYLAILYTLQISLDIIIILLEIPVRLDFFTFT